MHSNRSWSTLTSSASHGRQWFWHSFRVISATLVTVMLSDGLLLAQIHSPATRDSAITDTEFFTTAETCARCHSSAPRATALRDQKQRPIAPSDLWPASMMAHSSVDPLWRAVVAAEVAATPSRQAEIEAKCLRCHTPMASVQAEIDGVTPSRDRFLHGETKLAALAADGVSCTACHQIPADRVGEDESFSGQFQIGRDRRIFGPHRRPFAMPMYRHTGFVPTESPHVHKSAMCASCHTLITHALTEDGSPTGESLLEQGPYVEWQNSHFNDELAQPGPLAASCQDCHVPTTDVDGVPIQTRIARNPHGRDFPPVRPRKPFGRHVFTGGNTLMPSIIRASLAIGEASSKTAIASLDAAIERSQKMLREDTARIRISDVHFEGGKLVAVVEVENLAGHKLPTAYPSRRVWIRLRVFDADDRSVFSSGDFDQRGRIVDAGGRILSSELVGGAQSPHYSSIDRSEQVQIYEAVMEDTHGSVTYSLLRGARYRKDNRLLPKGWKLGHARGIMTSPAGTDDDVDFVSGTDRVKYRVDVPVDSGPFRVEADLWYQVLGARYAAELFRHDVPEMRQFKRLYESADPRPELLNRVHHSTKDQGAS